MTAADTLKSLDPTKSIVPFGDGRNHQFHHSDLDHIGQPTGISTEEGEFLYGLIRILRPHHILETGCNIGVSASFMCLGLRDNGVGHITTIEHNRNVAEIAEAKLMGMGFNNFTVFRGTVADYKTDAPLDFLWLDTELNQRFSELLRFYPLMNLGAIACIHDIWELDFDQFGGLPDELHELIKCGDLRVITIQTPHGLTLLQKRRKHDALADIHKS